MDTEAANIPEEQLNAQTQGVEDEVRSCAKRRMRLPFMLLRWRKLLPFPPPPLRII